MADSHVRVPEISPIVDGRDVDCETLVRNGVTYYRQRVNAMAYGLHEPTGENRPVRVYDGHLNVANYLDSVGMGKIANHVRFGGFGQRTGCSTTTTGDDCWEGTTTTCPIPDQTVGERLTILCANAADSAAGTGIQTLDIHGLDIAGNPQTEVIALNGGSVHTVRTDWRFNQSIHMETVGTNGTAVGRISIHRFGDAARIYNVITPGGNMSLNAARMVPLGKTYYLKSRTVSAASSKPMSIRQRATSTFEDTLTNGWAFLFKQPWFLFDSPITEVLPVPEEYPALSIIKATAYSAQAGGDFSFSHSGWYE